MKTLRRSLTNVNALVVFESAARLTSFTRAAEELNISQPAVTRHIKAVENLVGVALFRRNHNRLTVTADGIRLWASLAKGLGEIADTLEVMRSETRRRRLVLAANAGFAQQWLMPRFGALADLLRDFDVRLMISDADRELDDADFDVAVRMGSGAWPGQHSVKLIDEIVCPVASPSFMHRYPELRRATLAELAGAPLLHMDEGDKPWMTWRGWFKAQGGATAMSHPDLLYYNYPLVIQEVLAGRGIALGWRPLIDTLLQQGSLIPVALAVVNPHLGYYLTWSDREPGTGLATAMRRWFTAEFADPGATLLPSDLAADGPETGEPMI